MEIITKIQTKHVHFIGDVQVTQMWTENRKLLKCYRRNAWCWKCTVMDAQMSCEFFLLTFFNLIYSQPVKVSENMSTIFRIYLKTPANCEPNIVSRKCLYIKCIRLRYTTAKNGHDQTELSTNFSLRQNTDGIRTCRVRVFFCLSLICHVMHKEHTGYNAS